MVCKFCLVDAVLVPWPLAVLLSVCVSGALSSVVTALVAIAVCLVMKKRMETKNTMKATPIQASLPPPIYDTVTDTSGKERIEITGNVAYAHIK